MAVVCHKSTILPGGASYLHPSLCCIARIKSSRGLQSEQGSNSFRGGWGASCGEGNATSIVHRVRRMPVPHATSWAGSPTWREGAYVCMKLTQLLPSAPHREEREQQMLRMEADSDTAAGERQVLEMQLEAWATPGTATAAAAVASLSSPCPPPLSALAAAPPFSPIGPRGCAASAAGRHGRLRADVAEAGRGLVPHAQRCSSAPTLVCSTPVNHGPCWSAAHRVANPSASLPPSHQGVIGVS